MTLPVCGPSSVTLLGVWAAMALTAPLVVLCEGRPMSFSLNGAAAALAARRGPEEIRSVAKAFINRMRERHHRPDTTTAQKCCAAISHEPAGLPITRMRLRSEFIEDDLHRSSMLGDLEQMRSMLESVLSFLRNDGKAESMTLVDISAALHACRRSIRRYGTQGSLTRAPSMRWRRFGHDDLQSQRQPTLVENAVRFGAEVMIRLGRSPGYRDNRCRGRCAPAFPMHGKDVMLEPFVRGDDARNMNEASGFGLGLSIAQAHCAGAWRQVVAQ